MTIVVTIMCDASVGEGLCPTRTLGWPDVTMARTAADRDGWLVRTNGTALCPFHAGSSRRGPGGRAHHRGVTIQRLQPVRPVAEMPTRPATPKTPGGGA